MGLKSAKRRPPRALDIVLADLAARGSARGKNTGGTLASACVISFHVCCIGAYDMDAYDS